VPVAAGRSRDHHVPVAQPGPAVQRGQQTRGAFLRSGHAARPRITRLPARIGPARIGPVCIWPVLGHGEQRTERGRSGGLAEREYLPHPGPVRGLGRGPGQRG
jgi:hypothetical protein